MSIAPKLKGRDAVWYHIRHLRFFSIIDLETATFDDKATESVCNETIRTYVKALTKAKVLEISSPTQDGFSTRQYWKLIDDKGVITPRINADGKFLPETAQQQIWRAIRILKKFTLDALIASTDKHAKITNTNAKRYVGYLNKAGYLKETKPANPNQRSTYTLIPSKNTGPKPPEVKQVKNLFDPNLNQVVWTNQEDI
jgi:hypothetical protein